MNPISKREFLKKGAMCIGGAFFVNDIFSETFVKPDKWAREAMFYTVTPRGVRCLLCPNECIMKPGGYGLCHNRTNKDNKLYTIAFGNPCSVHVDPVEKKPLLHFLPNTYAFSIATAGCNFSCLNCQNWQISQTSPLKTQNTDLLPQQVIAKALENNCKSIAYTYSEPVVFYEYVYETSRLARQRGIKNLLISNGYINEEPLRKLCKVLDAANINLKSFSDDIYQRLNGGKLQPVLNTLKIMEEEGIWLEITNLVVPSWTDDFDMIKRMCDWLVKNGLANYPLHFLRFFPMYKLTQLPPTPIETLLKARNIALAAGCKYVYIGNVPLEGAEDTACPKCKRIVVERKGMRTTANHLVKGKCKWCHTPVPGVWA